MADGKDPADGIMDAALMRVVFDGWTEEMFRNAVADSGVDPAVASGLYPRGAVDVALDFHRRMDMRMVAALDDADMSGMRHGGKVALAVWTRIRVMAEHREIVRRSAALFALPWNIADGIKAMWGTADLIWRTLGDASEDINWYTKRATLSGVCSATALYWLGDESPDNAMTRSFIDRRIEDVARFEKFKAAVRGSPAAKPFLARSNWIARRVKRPGRNPSAGMPGSIGRQG